MEIQAKGFGKKKPHVELKQGPSHSYKLGKPVEHERLIDRGNDRYFEKVTDYESGDLIHQDDEPLSDHKGHGAAKKS